MVLLLDAGKKSLSGGHLGWVSDGPLSTRREEKTKRPTVTNTHTAHRFKTVSYTIGMNRVY